MGCGLVSGAWDMLSGESATQGAINAQTQATNQSNQTLRDMFDIQRDDMSPWRSAGVEALGQLRGGLGDMTRSFTMDDFQKDPGYQFRMDEGTKALERSAAARGGLNSGGTLKALTQYGQNYASNEYQNAYNRFNNDRDQKYNKLSNLAGLGQSSASQMSNAAGQLGQGISANQMGLGNAIGSATIGQANRTSGLLQQGISAGAMFSDERLKTNIQELTKENLKELRDAVRPYRFNYIDDEHGKGEWLGVMAQDLEKTKIGKNLVFEDEQGRKMIDFGKALSAIFVAELGVE